MVLLLPGNVYFMWQCVLKVNDLSIFVDLLYDIIESDVFKLFGCVKNVCFDIPLT